MSNIILVDDEVLARDRLRRMLEGEKDYEVIAEAANGDQAIRLGAAISAGYSARGHSHAGGYGWT